MLNIPKGNKIAKEHNIGNSRLKLKNKAFKFARMSVYNIYAGTNISFCQSLLSIPENRTNKNCILFVYVV